MLKFLGFRQARRSFGFGLCLIATVHLAAGLASAQGITVSLDLVPQQVYYISDFDILGTGSAAELFTLQINNQTGVPVSVVVRITIQSDRYAQPIIEAITQPFSINSSGFVRLSYRDFRGTGFNSNIRIDQFTQNTQSIGEITDAIMRTGRLPSGIYYINATVTNVDDPAMSPEADQVVLDLSSPSTLDLISPGMLVDQGECPMVFSAWPQFKWDSNADEFLLTVCEWLPTNSGPEDVMQNPPRLQVRVRRDTDFFGTPTYQYPAEALPLLEGKTYYWQVIALLASPAGEIQMPGPIWCFRVNSTASVEHQIALQQLLIYLENMGLNELGDLFEPGGPLEGFLPTGSARVNGRRVDLNEVLALLRNGSTRVLSFTIE